MAASINHLLINGPLVSRISQLVREVLSPLVGACAPWGAVSYREPMEQHPVLLSVLLGVAVAGMALGDTFQHRWVWSRQESSSEPQGCSASSCVGYSWL